MSTTLPDIMLGLTCAYCDKPTVLVDSAEVYNGRSFGPIYLCRPCSAWVGCHRGTTRALGRVANAELRVWKKAAHDAFDSLWRRSAMHVSREEMSAEDKAKIWREARSNAYAWLAQAMEIHPDNAHIGHFDVDLCKQVIQLCQQFLPERTP